AGWAGGGGATERRGAPLRRMPLRHPESNEESGPPQRCRHEAGPGLASVPPRAGDPGPCVPRAASRGGHRSHGYLAAGLLGLEGVFLAARSVDRRASYSFTSLGKFVLHQPGPGIPLRRAQERLLLTSFLLL